MKSNKFTTSQLTILGLMSGILFLMAYTPLGYLNIGPLAVTFNVIPVAICAVVLGPTGGAVAGAVAPARARAYRKKCLDLIIKHHRFHSLTAARDSALNRRIII